MTTEILQSCHRVMGTRIAECRIWADHTQGDARTWGGKRVVVLQCKNMDKEGKGSMVLESNTIDINVGAIG